MYHEKMQKKAARGHRARRAAFPVPGQPGIHTGSGTNQKVSPTRTIFSVLVPPACPIGSPTVSTTMSPRTT